VGHPVEVLEELVKITNYATDVTKLDKKKVKNNLLNNNLIFTPFEVKFFLIHFNF